MAKEKFKLDWIETPVAYINLKKSESVIDRENTPIKRFNDTKLAMLQNPLCVDLTGNKKTRGIATHSSLIIFL